MNTLEVKTRCPDLLLAARQLSLLGSTPVEQAVHVDTFFGVPEGLLRLREWRDSLEVPAEGEAPAGRAQLVAVLRGEPAADGSVVCRASLLAAKAPATLRAMYARMFGIRGVIKKARTSFPFHDLTVHADEVVGLGNFLEVHAPLGEDLDAVALRREQVEGLLTALSLGAGAIVTSPYLELLEAARGGG